MYICTEQLISQLTTLTISGNKNKKISNFYLVHQITTTNPESINLKTIISKTDIFIIQDWLLTCDQKDNQAQSTYLVNFERIIS